jgi:hypothetical protein
MDTPGGGRVGDRGWHEGGGRPTVPDGLRRCARSANRFVGGCCSFAARRGIWNGTGPTKATRQAGDQRVCGVEVRGFEPLASSVRETIRVIGRPGLTLGNGC